MGNFFRRRPPPQEDSLILAEIRLLRAQMDHQSNQMDQIRLLRAQMDHQINQMEHQSNQLEQITALNGLVISSLNVYDIMSATTADREKGLEEKMYRDFGYDPGRCMLTGVAGTVTLAHIFPWSGRKNFQAMSALKLTESMLHDGKNLLLLASNIETQFGKLKLSFIPQLGAGMTTEYVLKIWDENVRNEPIFAGSTIRIGDCENRALTFQPRHEVFSRCLAFQSLWAAAKHLGGIFREDSIPYRLGSLDENDRTLFLSIMKVTAARFHHSVAIEIEE